jgi:hypothetical protein
VAFARRSATLLRLWSGVDLKFNHVGMPLCKLAATGAHSSLPARWLIACLSTGGGKGKICSDCCASVIFARLNL